jgi:hypothetical protein
MLPVIVDIDHPAGDVGKVALLFHSQYAVQVRIRVLARIPCSGLEALAVPRPEVPQPICQLFYGLHRQAPAVGLENAGLIGLLGHWFLLLAQPIFAVREQNGTSAYQPPQSEHLFNLTLSR